MNPSHRATPMGYAKSQASPGSTQANSLRIFGGTKGRVFFKFASISKTQPELRITQRTGKTHNHELSRTSPYFSYAFNLRLLSILTLSWTFQRKWLRTTIIIISISTADSMIGSRDNIFLFNPPIDMHGPFFVPILQVSKPMVRKM